MPSQNAPASVGAPNAGVLHAGEHLDETSIIRVVPAFAGRDYRWGLPSLVRGLERAASLVNKRFPDSMLSVGDMSRKSGGEIGHHKSHQSGRDVDVGFYMTDREGSPLYAQRFVPFDGDGVSSAMPSARFDDARNWTLIEALITDPSLRMQRVFVSAPLRSRLLKEAERRNVPLWIRLRAAQLLQQPKTGVPHDNHFHIRIGCPPGQEAYCEVSPRTPSRAAPPPTPAPRNRYGTTQAPAAARKRLNPASQY